MLFTQNLTIIHHKTSQRLIDNLSFSVSKGDRLAIIGEEGNGKSSLLKVLAQQPHDFLEVTGLFKVTSSIGYCPQNIRFEGSVQEFFTSHLTLPITNYKIFNEFNLDPDIVFSQQDFNSLSGGEKMKCTLLTLLINQNELFLLDEPTNDLDIQTLEWLEDFINHSPNTFIFVTHDTTFLQHCANRFLLLEQTHRKTRARHSLFSGSFDDFMRQRKAQLEHQDKVAASQREEHKKKMDRYRQIRQKVDHALSSNSRQDPGAGKNLKDKMHTVKSMGKRFDKEKENFIEFSNVEEPIDFFFNPLTLSKQKEIVRLEHFNLKIFDTRIISDLNLVILGQDKIGIIGQNGMGKTTLLHHIYQQLKSDKSIKVGLMAQNYKEQLPLQELPADYLKEDYTKQEYAKVSTLLGSMNFTAQEMAQPIKQLSGGQQAKLLLLKLMHQQCNVLLLDEPTRNLSPLSLPVLFEALKNFQGCIIAISHDRFFLNEVINHVYELKESGLQPNFNLGVKRQLDLSWLPSSTE